MGRQDKGTGKKVIDMGIDMGRDMGTGKNVTFSFSQCDEGGHDEGTGKNHPF